MAELSLEWRRDWLSKRQEPVEGDLQEAAVQDLENTHCQEFLEAAKQLAIIATRRGISPENAVNHLKAEGHHPRVSMEDASYAMRRVTRKLTAQRGEKNSEKDQTLVQEVFPEEDLDLGPNLEPRKSKLDAPHHILDAAVVHLAQDPDQGRGHQGQDPDLGQTQKRANILANTLKVDLLERNQKSTSRKAMIDPTLPKSDLTRETPAATRDPAVQDRSPRLMEKRRMPQQSPSSRSRRQKVNK